MGILAVGHRMIVKAPKCEQSLPCGRCVTCGSMRRELAGNLCHESGSAVSADAGYCSGATARAAFVAGIRLRSRGYDDFHCSPASGAASCHRSDAYLSWPRELRCGTGLDRVYTVAKKLGARYVSIGRMPCIDNVDGDCPKPRYCLFDRLQNALPARLKLMISGLPILCD